jgi:magnesium transporter
MSVSRTLVHHSQGGFDEGIQLESISDLLPDDGNVLWLDIQDPSEQDIELLRGEFGFHELALEDVVKRHQRAKIDHYGDYCFIVFYAVRPEECREINLFVGDNYLVTVHQGDVPEIAETAERWRKNADRMEHGVALPVYSLLDAIVDAYFPVVDDIAERLEDLEDAILEARGGSPLKEVFALKKELLTIRRVLAPEREVLNILIRREEPILGERTLVYFQDVYDHILRVLDSVDLYRDQLTALLEAQLSVVSNRLNFVMKRMTALATILLSVTVVSSIYGMNFHVMPELEWEYGYAWALGLMVTLAVTVAVIFKRIDWL